MTFLFENNWAGLVLRHKALKKSFVVQNLASYKKKFHPLQLLSSTSVSISAFPNNLGHPQSM